MRKGNVLFLEDSDLIRGQSEFSFSTVVSGSRDQIATSDLVIAGNKVIKNRYSHNGIILPQVDNAPGPLDRSVFSNWETLKRETGAYEDRINNRISEILVVIHKAFDVEDAKYNWYFQDAPEGGMGEIYLPQSDEDEVSYNYQPSKWSPTLIENSIWDYKNGFPKKFFFMKDEEIEAYIRAEIKESKEIDARKKKSAKERAAAKKAAKEKALSKLSEQEKKLLGLAD
jgi:hypothetical protein